MRIPLLTIIKSKLELYNLSMAPFYRQYQISRQGYSQAIKRTGLIDAMMDDIKQKVMAYRLEKDRRAGSRSLYYNLGIKKLYGIGVTKFEHLMSTYGLSLQPMRIRVVTTKSCSQSWNYENLCNGLIVNNINQLVVGDLTYVAIGKNRYYLFSITDVFSLRIVGYCLSERMRKEEALLALEMFIELRGKWIY